MIKSLRRCWLLQSFCSRATNQIISTYQYYQVLITYFLFVNYQQNGDYNPFHRTIEKIKWHYTCTYNNTYMLVLYWTRTWWSGDDDETVKEGKRLILPGLYSRPLRSRESARNRERERKRGRERKKDTGTQALMEQRCFNQHGVGIYTVLQSSYSQQR